MLDKLRLSRLLLHTYIHTHLVVKNYCVHGNDHLGRIEGCPPVEIDKIDCQGAAPRPRCPPPLRFSPSGRARTAVEVPDIRDNVLRHLLLLGEKKKK